MMEIENITGLVTVISAGSIGLIVAVINSIRKIKQYIIEKKTNSVTVYLNNHQLHNIIMEIETGVEKRVMHRINIKEQKKNAIKNRFKMAEKEILIIIGNYIDTMQNTTSIDNQQIKNAIWNALILSIETAKIEAFNRLDLNHFDEIEKWDDFVNEQEDYLFNVFTKDFYTRTNLSNFSEKYKDIISNCEKILKRNIESAFSNARLISCSSVLEIEKAKKDRELLIKKIISDNSNSKQEPKK